MKKKTLRPRCPKGFTCKYYPYINSHNTVSSVDVFLFHTKVSRSNPIGEIRLALAYPIKKSNGFETHSDLNIEYHRQGLGTLLYAKAIQWCHDHGYRVGSSSCPSSLASQVWIGNGLKKYFNIRKVNQRWMAYPKRK